MNVNFDEQLLRYADGEADVEEIRAMEARLANDPDARTTVERLVGQRRLIKAVFQSIETSHPIDGLAATIRAQLKRKSEPRGRRFGTWALPLAASLLFAVISGVSGFYIADQRTDRVTAGVLAAQARDRSLLATAFEEALEEHISGDAVSWSNLESGAAGSVTPLRTFRNTDGQWCREFRSETTDRLGQETRIGIACRQAQAGWQIAVERPVNT